MTTEEENIINDIFKKVGGPIIEKEGLFLYENAKKVKNGVIVEIGSAHGRSTCCLAKGSKDGYGVKVYSIDPHAGGMYTPDPTANDPTTDGTPDTKYYINQGKGHKTFSDNLMKCNVSDIVIPIVDYSELAYKKGLDGHEWDIPIGLLWIDGDHRYNYVKMDIDLWAKHVISGGIILFHDYVFPGVTKAVKEMMLNNQRYHNFKGVGHTPIINVTVK